MWDVPEAVPSAARGVKCEWIVTKMAKIPSFSGKSVDKQNAS
jgi:hypothetical protein